MEAKRRLPGLLLVSLLLLAARDTSAAAPDAEQPAAEPPALLAIEDEETFQQLITKAPAPALVNFCADAACTILSGELEKIAKSLKAIGTVAAVDCSKPATAKVCRGQGITKFPHVVVFKPGSKPNPYTGEPMKEGAQHTGSMTARALSSALTDTLDDARITRVPTKAAAAELLAAQPRLATAVLFTDKPASTVLFKGLSWGLAGRMRFAEVRPDGEGAALAEQHGVAAYPTLLVIKPDGSSTRYEGPLKAPQLRAFLDGFAAPEPVPDEAGGSGSGGGDKPGGPAGSNPFTQLETVTLEPLGPANLSSIDESPDMWLIAFYADPEGSAGCGPRLESLLKLLQEVQGIASYGSFNTSGVEPELLQPFGLNTAALARNGCGLQLVLTPYGAGKQAKDEYARWEGGLDDAKALQDWILAAVPDLTHALTDEVVAQGFFSAGADALALPPPPNAAGRSADKSAPVGKVVLVSSKQEVPAIYRALAARFATRARLAFGWTPHAGAGVTLAKKLNVAKVPGMVVVLPVPQPPPGVEPPPNQPAGNLALQHYRGALKFQRMQGWLGMMALVTGLSYSSPLPGADAAAGPAAADAGAAAVDLHVTSQEQLAAACYDKGGLCLLVLLDGSSASADEHRNTTAAVAASLADKPVHWAAVDVSGQPSFRRAFGLEAEQLPALVALSPKRLRYAQAAPPFGAASAKALVDKVLAGGAVTLPLDALPRLVEGGEPDEGAAEAGGAAIEEEFDLDAVMAEDVDGGLLSKEQRLAQAEEELRREAEAAKAAKKKAAKKKKKSKTKKKAAAKKDEL